MTFETMTGTTGSTFTVVSKNAAGRVGFRNIGDDNFRVRVEPANGAQLSFPGNWTTPSYSQNRFSVVVDGVAELGAALTIAQDQLTKAAASLAQKVLAQAEENLKAAQEAYNLALAQVA